MKIICCDLEGVFLPEIWINVAIKTGIEELKLTTRDISDYDVLMKRRLAILDENHLTLSDIQDVINGLEPLDGAREMLDWIRRNTQIIILSDTFEEFARPLMAKLGFPTLFCHSLSVDGQGRITDYNIRIQGHKALTVKSLQKMNYKVIAFGDSYNDTDMIRSADHGLFFNPPESVTTDFPKIPVAWNYRELESLLTALLG